MTRLNDALRHVEACPLCGDSGADAVSQAAPNLYSEQLALLIGCDEALLLEAVHNRRCRTCGLWYKPRWFRSGPLQALFGERVPNHPKGWDAVSDRFSEDGFARELEHYRKALGAGSPSECARYRRPLASIVDSVIGIDAGGLRHRLQQAIEAGDLAQIDRLRPELAGRFNEPVAFKRFSGFSSRLLWDWMESHLGPIQRYGEVGCPLWGQLSRPSSTTAERYYFNRPETNYWGSGCRQRGQHCSERLGNGGCVKLLSWPPHADIHLDALGAFQYLDHLESPNAFVTEAFQRSRALLLILDVGNAPSAIQHFTGWDERSLNWLAHAHRKRVVADFDAMEASGNRAWLLCDD